MAKKRAKTPKRQSSANPIGSDQLERYRAAFLKLDEDGSLAISVEELFVAMRAIGLRLKISDVAEMIGEGDTNNDDELDFDEFVKVMEAAKNLRSSKAWISAYGKFVGPKSQTLKTGFLFDQEQSKQPMTPSVSVSVTNSTKVDDTPWWNNNKYILLFGAFCVFAILGEGAKMDNCNKRCQSYVNSINSYRRTYNIHPSHLTAPSGCHCEITGL